MTLEDDDLVNLCENDKEHGEEDGNDDMEKLDAVNEYEDEESSSWGCQPRR